MAKSRKKKKAASKKKRTASAKKKAARRKGAAHHEAAPHHAHTEHGHLADLDNGSDYGGPRMMDWGGALGPRKK